MSLKANVRPSTDPESPKRKAPAWVLLNQNRTGSSSFPSHWCCGTTRFVQTVPRRLFSLCCNFITYSLDAHCIKRKKKSMCGMRARGRCWLHMHSVRVDSTPQHLLTPMLTRFKAFVRIQHRGVFDLSLSDANYMILDLVQPISQGEVWNCLS